MTCRLICAPAVRSRILGGTGVPVTVLRAAIIIGHGGISWEITRQLVDQLPGIVAADWMQTQNQPIALVDVIRYLEGVLDHAEARGKVFEIGGPDVLQYREMLQRAAAARSDSAGPNTRVRGRRTPGSGGPRA